MNYYFFGLYSVCEWFAGNYVHIDKIELFPVLSFEDYNVNFSCLPEAHVTVKIWLLLSQSSCIDKNQIVAFSGYFAWTCKSQAYLCTSEIELKVLLV